MPECNSPSLAAERIQTMAIPSLFGQSSYLIGSLEPLRREQPLRNIEKSGCQDTKRPIPLFRGWVFLDVIYIRYYLSNL